MEIDQIPLIGGHSALDFVNTVEAHDAPDAANYLPSYDHLLRWSARVGLLSAAQVALLAEAHHPWLTEGAWSEAMDLRRAMDAIFRAIAKGKPPPERALETFNATLAAAQAHRRLENSASGLAWDWGPHRDKLELAPWTIALNAAQLLTDPARRAQIKVCDNHACDWLFLDDSPSGRRRWCRMNVCGNAAKVRRFREKQKQA
jgi:predicted RNA-binding Zn ribbon-like protein